MAAALATEWRPHRASELQRSARPHLVRALLFGDLLGILAFALAWTLSLWVGHSVATHALDARILVEVLPPPPPMLDVGPPPKAVVPVKPVPAPAAVPVPVPEAQVPAEAVAPSPKGREATTTGTQGQEGVVIRQSPEADEIVNRPGTVPLVDQLPEPIRRVKPRYPELAYQAQVTGLVRVNLLVGKDGRVRDAVVDPKAHVPMLDQAALEAARQWEFQPALVQGRPVAVWVALPFRFTLR